MQLSGTEWKVMGRVWARETATVRDVLEDLEAETGWAYTTVKTIMDRLVEKGVLTARKRANTSVFAAVMTRNQARHSAIRSLLDRAFDGAFGPLMAHLIDEEKLSAGDRRKLRDMLEAKNGKGTSDARRR